MPTTATAAACSACCANTRCRPTTRFLRRLWPNVKQAVEFMIARDGNADGMLEGAQPNTLDASWYGKISFISSLYLAMLKAGAAMAEEMGDEPFAAQCREIAREASSRSWKPTTASTSSNRRPAHLDKIGVGVGCYIDQVFGQTWAHWVGLGRTVRPRQTALRAAGFVEVQLRARRGTVPRAVRTRPLVRHGRRRRIDHVLLAQRRQEPGLQEGTGSTATSTSA
jgi:hypothetical protein